MKKKIKKLLKTAIIAAGITGVMTIPSFAGTWLNVAGNWAYTNDGTTFANGWISDNGASYYIDPVTNFMVTGWKNIDNEWYFFNGSGMKKTGWIQSYESNHYWYYCGQDGKLLRNTTTPDGYYVGSDGLYKETYAAANKTVRYDYESEDMDDLFDDEDVYNSGIIANTYKTSKKKTSKKKTSSKASSKSKNSSKSTSVAAIDGVKVASYGHEGRFYSDDDGYALFDEYNVGDTEFEKMLNMLNAYRSEKGIDELEYDDELEAIAQERAELMESVKELSHEPDGVPVSDSLRENGYSFSAAAENANYGRPDARDSMNGWKDSSGHNANMLNKRVTKVGFGHAGKFWVQLFAA